MLYSIVPNEDIWSEESVDYNFHEVMIDGFMVQVEPIDGASGRVVRVISTDPQAYLNPTFQPGSLVPLGSNRS